MMKSSFAKQSIRSALIFTFTAVLTIFFHGHLEGDVRLPKIFSNNMVLQQNKPIRFFGWASAGEEITVTIRDKSAKTKADEEGHWRVDLPAMKADGKPFSVIVAGKNKIELKNVILGEVWICSGQSNMEWSVQGSMNPKQEIAEAKYPRIRLFNVPRHISSSFPKEDVQGRWVPCTPETVRNFSAVGYYFGRKLHKDIDVPIGLIGTNWGGTRIEPWTPPEGFASVPELKRVADQLKKLDPKSEAGKKYYQDHIASVENWLATAKEKLAAGKNPGNPPMRRDASIVGGATVIYNGMVHGIKPFMVRGTIWYQGESNAGDGLRYAMLKKALVQGWRKVFENEDLSFYWVQLANFQQPSTNPQGGGWGPVREGQRLALSLPNTGMAVTIDIGAARDIHPRNKQDVGKRLALWALRDHYGKKITPSGPLYKSMAVEGDQIRITFDHVGSGLMVGKKEGQKPTVADPKSSLNRFAIAGADKKWHWATAKIDGKSVIVKSDKVAKPVAVRYGYESNPVGANLYNKEGLPASPFRTDNW